jgi:hypothetical protein
VIWSTSQRAYWSDSISSAGGGARALVSFGLVAGPILSMIDSLVVNVAVSDLVRELRRPLGTVQWTISG